MTTSVPNKVQFMWNFRTGEITDYEVGANGLPFHHDPVEEREWVTGYAMEAEAIQHRDEWLLFRSSGGTLKEFWERI